MRRLFEAASTPEIIESKTTRDLQALLAAFESIQYQGSYSDLMVLERAAREGLPDAFAAWATVRSLKNDPVFEPDETGHYEAPQRDAARKYGAIFVDQLDLYHRRTVEEHVTLLDAIISARPGLFYSSADELISGVTIGKSEDGQWYPKWQLEEGRSAGGAIGDIYVDEHLLSAEERDAIAAYDRLETDLDSESVL